MTKLITAIKSLFLFITFTLAFSLGHSQHAFSQTQPAWTPEAEKEIYDLLYDQSQQLLVKDEQRKEWAGCAVQRLKAALPQGMESVSQDSISHLAQTIGAGCILNVSNAMFKWSPMMVETIKQKMLTRPELKDVEQNQRPPLVDCLLDKYQQQFPDGFTIALIDAAATKYVKDCIAEISTKKP